ncbi:hemerythrin-like metal-binding protein [Hydrogenobacter thermophilus TK-6]|uniref:Hemerythrin-like metal-binding protein n=1 Tax=Hydrogenobacter thermophilus (strain DSM 6534 / IAM 12695 / TK-6) TaxID=608538 RepID=D3DJC9_HYDTT|nr:hemerythrin domain-containing protein [Hydrogenobacter thermophilus]ADO45853.1 hemerythrin-like metal-binding protein [Hydrogenobacter thermophilus TK-6]BAI69931.1 hemerythrin-like metal-binding protein [Hydrogenobacter thermophilus TK-6]
MIEFDNSLITHVEEMDKQHLRLVALLNNTYEPLKIGYPELESHRKVHEIFRREVKNLAPYVERGDLKAFREALSYSWGWLYNHIAKTDKKYGIYAKERGLI